MKHSVMLTITSLLSILFLTFHLADDIIRGYAPGGVANMVAIAIVVVWLYAALVLAERRIGVCHQPPLFAPRVGSPRHPHDGVGTRRREVRWSHLLRLDAPRARLDLDLRRHPLGARPVEPATGQVPVVQQPEHGGIGIAIVFFGFFCLLTGYLIFKSTFLPRVIGVLISGFIPASWASC